MNYKTELFHAATEAAKEYKINEEKRALFIQGATWAVDKLMRITEVHPMEESAGALQMCDKIRLKDVNTLPPVVKYWTLEIV